MKYLVVIGDIVSSRRIPHRSQLQEQLAGVLTKLNREKESGVLSPYTITLGDEYQAVFTRADEVFRHAAAVLQSLHPVKARFSFGIGRIETAINPKQAIGMDGEAFYLARAGLEELKSRRSLFAVSGMHEPLTGLITQSLDIVSHLCRKWKKSRLQIFSMLYNQAPVKLIAAETHMTDKAVYKSIDAGALKTIHQLFDQITLLMNSSLVDR